MQSTTFFRIAKTIGLEIAKSAGLVILSSLVAQSLRKSTQGASESMAQGLRFAKNKIYDLRNNKAA
jgi:hypothetical protein